MSTSPAGGSLTGAQAYRRLLRYTRKFWVFFLIGTLGFLFNGLTEAASAKLIQYIIDAIQHRNQEHMNWFPVLVIAVVAMRGIGSFIGNYFLSLVSRSIVYEMRRELFDKLLVLPAAYYHLNSPGHIAAKIIFNVEQVAAAATDALKTMVREGFIVITLLSYLFYMNWRLSLSLFVIAPMAALLVRAAGKRFRKLSSRIQNAMGDVNHVVNETILAFQVVKNYGGEKFERERFDKASRENLRQGMKMVVTAAISTPMVQLLLAVAMGGVIWIALQPALMQGITAGEFVSYIVAAGMLQKPVRALTDINEKIQRGIAASTDVFQLLDMPPESDTGTLAPARLQGDIEFRHVGFAYQEGNPVLRDISLHVRPGQTVALVGRSGSGKTSLVNLLQRYYEPGEGEIRIDGHAVEEYRLDVLRRQIATVSQKVVLFDDSIFNNIAYGAFRDRTREDVERVARAAYAHDFIMQLPLGYDTRVGQDGVQLSGGQRQRLAIARALIKDAPILVLDEATSALDNESEFHIQSALEEVMKGRTTLVIAHRLSTIEKADLIVVMDQGCIVETGTHAELLARGGSYAQLHSRNFADDEAATPGAV
ncbi:MAG: lipid transporter ATP-binding/permease [Moraxellaceae bacterium]|jgi:subfamily B ATP-binding cassette protein MsbA|nr:lipid transporter ATP-binding/permease [Moraxellaceae bacterium]